MDDEPGDLSVVVRLVRAHVMGGVASMRVGVLGPVTAHDAAGAPIDLGGPKQRGVLAMLASSPGTIVSTGALAEGLWGEQLPGNADATLQVYISNLRRALAGGGKQGRHVIRRAPPGYLLDPGAVEVDLTLFRHAGQAGRALLTEGDSAAAATRLLEALGYWRGPAVADLLGLPCAAGIHDVLGVELLEVAVACVRAQTDSGSHEEAVARARALLVEHPTREALWQSLVLALYRSGRQAEALAAYGEAREVLADELGIDPGGELQALHAAVLRQDPDLLPVAAARHNLPVQLTSFVGRVAEVADLTGRIRDGGRLITIKGFGGMGKTRLALAVAADLVDAHPDGVWFVDLSGVDDVDAVPREIASVLGVRDAGRGMGEAVLEHLGGRRVLLVLDNLEQILGCAPFVARLVAGAPGVQVLVTSREPLGLRGEVVYALEPFPRVAAAGAERSPAVTLFADRARDAVHGFTVGEDNAAAVAAICDRLDGVPLAIELAAARVNLLTPLALLDRLEQSLGLLAGGERDRPDRHRTVRATVAWSYELLNADERTLLTRLSVFPGTAGLEAVEAVCAGSPGEPPLEVLPLLASLVDKSLVHRSEQDRESRFSLLVSVRDFATEQLAPTESQSVAQAHLAYYLARSVAGALAADGPDAQPWYDEMRRDAHNLRAALAHAETNGQVPEHLMLAANLFEFWQFGGHWAEGPGHIDRALAAGGAPDDPALVAYAASVQSWLFAPMDAEEGIALARRSIELATSSSDLLVTAFAQLNLAFRLLDRSAKRTAFEETIRLVQAARAAGAQVRWGSTRPDAVEIGAGGALARLDRWEDPRRARQLTLPLRERAVSAGRDADVSVLEFLLAQLAADVGDLATAEPLFDNAVEAARRRHDKYWLCNATLARARSRARSGLDTVEDLAAVLDRFREVGTDAVALTEVLLGDLRAVDGDITKAEEAYRRVAAISPNVDDRGAGWRLLRLDRLTGRDTRGDLDAIYALQRRSGLWPRPDALGCLVEAAAVAEAHGQSDRAALLVATVTGMRGDFLLPEIVLSDLGELTDRYGTEPARRELPEHLFQD